MDPNSPQMKFIRSLVNPRNEPYVPQSVGGLVNNAVKGVANVGSAVLQLPGQILNGVMHPISQGLPGAGNMVKGFASNVNNLLGEPVKTENGQVTGLQAPSLVHAGQTIYKDPINAALTAGAVVGGLEGLAKPKEGGLSPIEKPNALTKLGGKMTSDVAPVKLPTSIYGSAKEAAVQKVVDSLPGNTAQAKYASLAPKMEELGGKIQKTLAETPKMYNIADIKAQVLERLAADPLRPLTGIEADQAAQGVLNSLYKKGTNDPKSIIPSAIDSPSIFELKKAANPYSSIASGRIGRDTATSADRAMVAFRDVLDENIAKDYPAVKEATLQQSALYDAMSSLDSARDINHGFNFLGTSIPSEVGSAMKSGAGKVLTTAGKAAGLPSTLGGIPGMLPALGSSLGVENVQEKTDNTNQNNEFHNNIIPQPSNRPTTVDQLPQSADQIKPGQPVVHPSQIIDANGQPMLKSEQQLKTEREGLLSAQQIATNNAEYAPNPQNDLAKKQADAAIQTFDYNASKNQKLIDAYNIPSQVAEKSAVLVDQLQNVSPTILANNKTLAALIKLGDPQYNALIAALQDLDEIKPGLANTVLNSGSTAGALATIDKINQLSQAAYYNQIRQFVGTSQATQPGQPNQPQSLAMPQNGSLPPMPQASQEPITNGLLPPPDVNMGFLKPIGG